MAGPIQLYFDVWPAATPASGSALGELTQARDKKIQKVLSDVGLGQFTINRHDSQAAWCESGNLVRVRLVGGGPFAWNSANYKFAFYIEDLTDEIVSPDEEAGDDWTRGGRGILSVLERLVWWSSNFMGAVGTRTDGKWHWYNDQFGDIFHRAILEWNARPAPKPIPATLGLDFSSSIDSEGTSWPSFAGAHEIDITQDYLAAAFDLCSQGLEIGMKPDYTTQAWVQAGKGTDKSATVAFRHGWNIRHAGSRVGFGPKRATRALVRGSNNTFVEVTDGLTAGDEAGKWGRREVGITYQKSADTAPLTRAGQQALRSLRVAEAGPPQFGVTSYGSGTDGGSPPAKQDVLPFTDYDEGDIVTFDVPGEYANVAKRIHAITIEDGENGEGEVTLTLEGAPFDGSAGGSPTEAPGGGAAGCDCPPNPPFAPPCGPETPGSIIAEWHFTSGPYDDSGLYHSGLLVGGPTYCPGATLCGYNTASHRASSALPVTAGNSYVVTGLISWRFDPTNRPLHIEFYASNGSLISRLEVIAGVGHATGTTYTFSATVLAPTGATTARLWHSPYMGSFVDDVVFGTASGTSSNDPYCVAVPGSSPYAARSDEVGTGTTTVLAERGAPMLNSSGVALTRGTVVVIDPLNAIAVTTTTAVGQTARGVGVLLEDIAVAEFGRVAFEGVVEELLVGSAAAIGDHLTTSATAGKAAVAAARGVGTFGEVLAKEVVQQPILVAFGAASGVSVGSISSASGLTLPTGWQENDIFLLFHVTAALGDVPSGWTAVTNSPQDPPGSNVRALNVYWRRATASESVPTITSTDGGNAYAVIAAFRGCPTTGNPWNVTSGGTEASDTSVEIPGATTTIDKSYVLAVTARGLADTVAPQYSGWTNADLSSLTEIFDAGSSAGLGTGLGIAAGVKETAGAYGTTTATLANADTDAMMTIALAATSLSSSTVVALLYGQADPPASAVSETTDGTVQAAIDKLRARAWKEPVRAATTAAGTLASSFENGDTIDGVTLATGDRILLKDQAAGAENGIYVVSATGAPARATDMDASSEVLQATVQASEGTVNADKFFRCTTNAPITLGTTALVFAEMSGGGAALTVEESDGAPTVAAVDKIKFAGAIVEDQGSGDVLVTIARGPAPAEYAGSLKSDAIFYAGSANTWTAVTTTTRDVAAAIGDRLQYSLGFMWVAAAGTAVARAEIVDSGGTLIRSIPASAAGVGLGSTYTDDNDYRAVSALVPITVQAGDLSSGRLYVRMAIYVSATGKGVYTDATFQGAFSLHNIDRGRSSGLVDFASTRRTASSMTPSSTSWADLDTGLDLVLTAAPGDAIEIGASGWWLNEARAGYLDVATIVAGSPVNYIGATGGAGDFGVQAWVGEASVNDSMGGTVLYTVVAGDVSAGTVRLRLRVRTSTAGTKTLYAAATSPFQWYAKNLGQLVAGNRPALVGCKAYNSAVQSIANNTEVAATFDSEDYDPPGLHSTSSNTSRITADRAGVWRFVYHIFHSSVSATGVRYAYLRINGTTKVEGSEHDVIGSSATNPVNALAVDVELAAGDYVEVMAFQNSGSARDIGWDYSVSRSAVNSFSAQYLGSV